jgi:hypothetical protein
VLKHKLTAAVTAVTLVAGGSGAALAATQGASAPRHATIKAVNAGMQFKINRWVKDQMRWNRDVYRVRTGGTITIVNNAAMEGPHTFSVVAKKDLPRTAQQINNCRICMTIAQEHGADPNSEAPPKYMFTENGTGTNTKPDIDQPGDSVFIPPTNGYSITLHVTAKAGTVLNFLCAVHPWMQAKIIVTK